MKLYGVMMVRNEADIIEASVRHNLGTLDRLLVVDHGSFDGTSEILRHLCAELPALRVLADPSIAFSQSATITHLARQVLGQNDVEFVFALDGDEFLKVPSRELLLEALRNLPPGLHALLDWQTYVPNHFEASAAAFSPALASRRLKTERQTLHKVIVARHFTTRLREAVADGNHLVWDIDHPGVMPAHARILPAIAAIAHVPVRSRLQLEKKVVIGYLAHMAAHGTQTHMAYHWRDLYAEIRAGISFDDARLREIACNYGLPRTKWQAVSAIELVQDAIAAADVELRYEREAELDTMQLLMRFCERMVTASLSNSGSK